MFVTCEHNVLHHICKEINKTTKAGKQMAGYASLDNTTVAFRKLKAITHTATKY